MSILRGVAVDGVKELSEMTGTLCLYLDGTRVHACVSVDLYQAAQCLCTLLEVIPQFKKHFLSPGVRNCLAVLATVSALG